MQNADAMVIGNSLFLSSSVYMSIQVCFWVGYISFGPYNLASESVCKKPKAYTVYESLQRSETTPLTTLEPVVDSILLLRLQSFKIDIPPPLMNLILDISTLLIPRLRTQDEVYVLDSVFSPNRSVNVFPSQCLQRIIDI